MAKTKAKPEKNKNNKFYKQTKKQTNKQNKEEENTQTQKSMVLKIVCKKKNLITRTPLHIGVNRKKDNTYSKYDDRSLVFSCTRIIYLSGLGCTNLN